MISKYPGRCKGCSKPYAEGDDIYWTKEDGSWCWDCRENPKPTAAQYELAAGMGFIPHEGMAADGLLLRMRAPIRVPAAGRTGTETRGRPNAKRGQ